MHLVHFFLLFLHHSSVITHVLSSINWWLCMRDRSVKNKPKRNKHKHFLCYEHWNLRMKVNTWEIIEMVTVWLKVWFCIIIGLDFICGIITSKKLEKLIEWIKFWFFRIKFNKQFWFNNCPVDKININNHQKHNIYVTWTVFI